MSTALECVQFEAILVSSISVRPIGLLDAVHGNSQAAVTNPARHSLSLRVRLNRPATVFNCVEREILQWVQPASKGIKEQVFVSPTAGVISQFLMSKQVLLLLLLLFGYLTPGDDSMSRFCQNIHCTTTRWIKSDVDHMQYRGVANKEKEITVVVQNLA